MGRHGLGCEEARAASRVPMDAHGLFGAGCAQHAEAVTMWEHTCLSRKPGQGTRWAGKAQPAAENATWSQCVECGGGQGRQASAAGGSLISLIVCIDFHCAVY